MAPVMFKVGMGNGMNEGAMEEVERGSNNDSRKGHCIDSGIKGVVDVVVVVVLGGGCCCCGCGCC